MGTHLRVLSESFLMSTNMTGFRCFSELFAFFCMDAISLSMERVKAKVTKPEELYTLIAIQHT